MADDVYHVTFTKNIPDIQERGLDPVSQSLWKKQETGGRYQQKPAVYAFTNPEDALSWAGIMSWDFRDEAGKRSDYSIIRLKGGEHWEDDPSEDPRLTKGRPTYQGLDDKDPGRSVQYQGHIKPEDIVSITQYPEGAGVNEEFKAKYPEGMYAEWIKYYGDQLRGLPQDEPRSTDLVEYAPIPEPVKLPSTDLVEQRPGLPRLTGIGQAFRGIGSMIGGPKLRAVRKLITMAQQGYELLPEEQKLLGDVLDMEALTKPIPGTGRGLEYFRQLLGMKPRSLEEAYPDLREKLGLYEDEQGGITSLPMDEASRMARAGEQKFDIDSYHGTRDDFTIFEKGDLGYHFGTPEQAWKRLVDTRKTADWEPHNAEENILPVRLRLKNPLELPDVGSWQLPEVIARRALETKWGKSHSNELNEIMDEAAELSPTFADLDDWADSPEASELMDELRDMIKKDGYDGIKYRNIVESKYGKEGGGLTVEGHKQYEALNKEWHELRRAIFIRNEQAKRPLPHPSEATPEKVQEWLNRGLDTTPEERARLEQIAKLKELVRKNESYDPHSYIVFDAENIRSRFAEFDPAQSESPEISKAAGGFIDKPLYGRA